jgi:DnaK suppressor protein
MRARAGHWLKGPTAEREKGKNGEMRKASVAKRGCGAAEDYRALLQDKRLDLLSNLGIKFDTLASMGRVPEEDQAQVSHEEFISMRLNGLDYEQLRLVQEALDRLDSGEFGVCQACEEPISSKRLKAIPWARYCVHCQERLTGADSGQAEPMGNLAVLRS